MTDQRRVLVTGATGYVGSRLVPELLDQGYEVCASGRSIDRLQAQSWSQATGVSLAEGNVADPQTLVEALAGVEIAYYLVHSMGQGNASYASDDLHAARAFATACAHAGVARIVYLSGLGRHDDNLSVHLRSRHQTGDALREAGVPVTELRAAIIIGSGSASFEIMRDLARKLPIMITPRWVRTRCEPIAIRDVLFYLIAVLSEPRTIAETLEMGCGRTHEYADMLRVTARAYSRFGTRILAVPVLTPRLSSWWLHLVTTVDVSLARELVDGMRNDVVCEDTRLREWIARDTLDLETAVALARKVERDGTAPSRWTDADRQRRPSPTLSSDSPTFVDERAFTSSLSPVELYDRVCALGGSAGYGPAQPLWRVRAALDRLVGGVGFRRGRPRRALRVGDAIDFWRVSQLDAGHLLELRAEMRPPGTAFLRFEIEPHANGSRLTQRATLTREGPASALYWYAISPLHGFVFSSLGRHLTR